MKKFINLGSVKHTLAIAVSSMLCTVLYICANTTSSTLIHQPKAPESLDRFKKAK